jgi:hypothetical protein
MLHVSASAAAGAGDPAGPGNHEVFTRNAKSRKIKD